MAHPDGRNFRDITVRFPTASLLFISLAAAAVLAPARTPAQGSMPVTDMQAVGNAERVEMGDGKYKLVRRNKAGQVVSAEVYERRGTLLKAPERLLQTVEVKSTYTDGQPAEATVTHWVEGERFNVKLPM